MIGYKFETCHEQGISRLSSSPTQHVYIDWNLDDHYMDMKYVSLVGTSPESLRKQMDDNIHIHINMLKNCKDDGLPF